MAHFYKIMNVFPNVILIIKLMSLIIYVLIVRMKLLELHIYKIMNALKNVTITIKEMK